MLTTESVTDIAAINQTRRRKGGEKRVSETASTVAGPVTRTGTQLVAGSHGSGLVSSIAMSASHVMANASSPKTMMRRLTVGVNGRSQSTPLAYGLVRLAVSAEWPTDRFPDSTSG